MDVVYFVEILYLKLVKLDDDFGGTPISGILQEELLGWGKIGGLRVYKVGPTNDSDS